MVRAARVGSGTEGPLQVPLQPLILRALEGILQDLAAAADALPDAPGTVGRALHLSEHGRMAARALLHASTLQGEDFLYCSIRLHGGQGVDQLYPVGVAVGVGVGVGLGVGVGVGVGLGGGVAEGAGVFVLAGVGAGAGVAVATVAVGAGVLVALLPPPKTLFRARSATTMIPTTRRTRIAGKVHFCHWFDCALTFAPLIHATAFRHR